MNEPTGILLAFALGCSAASAGATPTDQSIRIRPQRAIPWLCNVLGAATFGLIALIAVVPTSHAEPAHTSVVLEPRAPVANAAANDRELREINALDSSASERIGLGAGISAIGIAGVVGSGVFFSRIFTSDPDDDPIGYAGGAIGNLFYGAVLLHLSIATTTGGILIFTSGKRRQSRAQERRRNLRVQPTVSGDGFGAAVSGRF